jgi:hypothetical protein
MNDHPPVALGRLDDESRHVWLSPRPVGVLDWIETVCLVVLALPVLVTFGPVVLALRAFGGRR